LDIDLLKTFIEVHRARHFGRAARQLFLTQSAVSARIRLLEDRLGIQLFNRKRNDIQLTPAGARLLKYAENMVITWERARQEVCLEPQFNESLAVGALVDLWDILVQDWLHRVHATLASVALRAEAYTTEVLIRKVLDGVLDLAFVFEPPALPDLVVRETARVELVMVSTRPGQRVEQALQDDYVMVDWGVAFEMSHARHFPDAPAPALHMGLGNQALRFLLARGGAAYLASSSVQARTGKNRLWPVEGAPVIERSVHVLYRAGSSRESLIEQILALFDAAEIVPSGEN
jgi:DNA-binding transcriptional LysR family regulator